MIRKDKIDVGVSIMRQKLYYNDLESGMFESDVPRTGWTPKIDKNETQKCLCKANSDCTLILEVDSASGNDDAEIVDYGQMVITDVDPQGSEILKEWVQDQDDETVRETILENLGFGDDRSTYVVEDMLVGDRDQPNQIQVSSIRAGKIIYEFDLK